MDEQLGKVAEWRDDRGFGFIQPRESDERVFFHVRAYRQDGRRPEVGEWVKYRPHRAQDGRWQAIEVRRAVAPALRATVLKHPRAARTSRFSVPAPLQWLLVAGYAALLAWSIDRGRLPLEFVAVPALLSAVTWVAYALDKEAARTGRWRTQESVLHVLELLGGWPGAIAAQQFLRHKSRKMPYRVTFWVMTLLHAAVVTWWVFRRG
ncbi:DUF1294 domain-containing protein [Pseudoxanthomonas indica]|uniref:Uncharacterized membrane protein YsdA, DUF1294 family n=1 Tax=Pseudoxanthomonas indica TaxID=428993 RepID=A0A1T5LKS1_9GAMM|nr:cold shock and DUF1294 domain-containing protein [Pseudoxanthomonas indica]GGD36285.1 DNA-binding protein [Pseudoxanthomonas indica]SKC76385.1 Uncharacterized membrane protein YsdA, DUF1294 family [Pseudoxanthomonas indica]